MLVDGELTLYMERGGKTLLAWPSDPDGAVTQDARLSAAAETLAAAARADSLGTVTVERVNGASALTSPFGALLEGAGFIATPADCASAPRDPRSTAAPAHTPSPPPPTCHPGAMPEGDTVWQAARRLHLALAGKVLIRSDLRVPRYARPTSPAAPSWM